MSIFLRRFAARFTCAALLVLLVPGCSSPSAESSPDAAEWRELRALESSTPREDARARQRLADALLEFRRRYPEHRQARELWDSLELDAAVQLGEQGNPREAVRRIEALLSRKPSNPDSARDSLVFFRGQMSLHPDRLSLIETGMTPDEVSERLGTVQNGWTRKRERGESWFYRLDDGNIAAVHFSRDRVIAVDPGSRTTR